MQSKVGTTTVMEMFINLLPDEYHYLRKDTEKLHQQMGQVFSLNARNKLQDRPILNLKTLVSKMNYFAFSFVRHPFDRLVSAYLDKIVNNKVEFYNTVAENIHKKYGNVTFENFLLHILSTRYDPDPHWIPYYKVCPYCDITKYAQSQFTGRLETFESDLRYFLFYKC